MFGYPKPLGYVREAPRPLKTYVKMSKPLEKIWHPWWLWEDYKAGFYETLTGIKKQRGEEIYAEFLSSRVKFNNTLVRVTKYWKYSCEHNLTCKSMNRIAYLGQSSVCFRYSIPSCCRGGFMLLDKMEREEANNLALYWLNKWLKREGYEEESERVRADMESKRVFGRHS